MAAVLISIRPEWCEKIASGEKTIECRKTRPKIDPPFKCYIYQTHEGQKEGRLHSGIIGEFICRKIQRFDCGYDSRYNVTGAEIGDMCLTYDQFYRYGKNRPLYGFGISDLKIYDTPKELSDYQRMENGTMWSYPVKITRPPQSWMYVEELI